MIFEVNWLCKRLFTKLAAKGCLSGMHSFVICQRSRIGKWFFTNITDARLFTTMHSLMRPQGKSFSEGLDTKIACKFTILSCMRKFMTHKSSCLAETFVTLGTFMWLHSSMDPFVSFQLINLAEMFLTNFTNMRLHWNLIAFGLFVSVCTLACDTRSDFWANVFTHWLQEFSLICWWLSLWLLREGSRANILSHWSQEKDFSLLCTLLCDLIWKKSIKVLSHWSHIYSFFSNVCSLVPFRVIN